MPKMLKRIYDMGFMFEIWASLRWDFSFFWYFSSFYAFLCVKISLFVTFCNPASGVDKMIQYAPAIKFVQNSSISLEPLLKYTSLIGQLIKFVYKVGQSRKKSEKSRTRHNTSQLLHMCIYAVLHKWIEGIKVTTFSSVFRETIYPPFNYFMSDPNSGLLVSNITL